MLIELAVQGTQIYPSINDHQASRQTENVRFETRRSPLSAERDCEGRWPPTAQVYVEYSDWPPVMNGRFILTSPKHRIAQSSG